VHDWSTRINRQEYLGFEYEDAEVCHESTLQITTQERKVRRSLMVGKKDSFSLKAAHTSHSDLGDPRLQMKQMQSAPSVSYAKVLGLDDEEVQPPPWAARLHQLLEDPNSSWAAVVINVIITLCIVLSLLILVVKPIVCKKGSKGSDCRDHPLFWYPDLIMASIFTAEWIARLLAATFMGRKAFRHFARDMSNVFDIIAVMPTWLSVIFGNGSGAFLVILRLARFLKLARIVRVMRMRKYASSAKKPTAERVMKQVIEPSAVVMLVIWAIYMKEVMKDEE
jgi:hypothetical protein